MKESFILFTEQWPAIALLSDRQKARLMQAIFALHGACEMPELNTTARAIFLMMKPRFEANLERYEQRCEQNRENARKGGRPQKNKSRTAFEENTKSDFEDPKTDRFSEENQKTDRFFEENPKTLTDSDTDSDPDTDSDTDSDFKRALDRRAVDPVPEPQDEITDPEPDAKTPDIGFEQFFDAFPAEHRGGRIEAEREWMRLAGRKALPGLSRVLDSLTAWQDADAWKEQNGRYVPTAANFLKREYWLRPPRPGGGTDGRSGTRNGPQHMGAALQRMMARDELAKMVLTRRSGPDTCQHGTAEQSA